MRLTKKIVVGLIVLVFVAGVEIFSRFILGLGDPPLSISDEELDYMFAPNQDCMRFGNHVYYNNCSMRSDFPVNEKDDPEERIFVVGDSVVNGGVLTDHRDLATTILQERVDATRSRVQVCHVSAGSWGPGNYAAYFRKYSNLVRTNDIIIVELNSHDLWEDDPLNSKGANVGKDIALPDHKPWCATWDGFDRYFIPRMRKWFGLLQVNTKIDVPKWEDDADSESAKYNLTMLNELFSYPWVKKFLLIHRSREEARENQETVGERAFRRYAAANGIVIVTLKLDENTDYRDNIHLSSSGQRKMADTIVKALMR